MRKHYRIKNLTKDSQVEIGILCEDLRSGEELVVGPEEWTIMI